MYGKRTGGLHDAALGCSTDHLLLLLVRSALADLRRALSNAQTALDRPGNKPREVIADASELLDLLGEAAEAAASSRVGAVRRLRREERLSLSELAAILGLSKSRAAQLARDPDQGEGSQS